MSVCIPARQENGPKATEGVNVSLGISLMSGWRGEIRGCICQRALLWICAHAENETCLKWSLDVGNLMRLSATCVKFFCISLTNVFITAALSMPSWEKLSFWKGKRCKLGVNGLFSRLSRLQIFFADVLLFRHAFCQTDWSVGLFIYSLVTDMRKLGLKLSAGS